MKLILARLVREIGDPPAIGRPSRVPFHHAGSVRQVADGFPICRHGKDLTTCLANGSIARRGEARGCDPISDLHNMRTNLREVVRKANGKGMLLLSLQIEQMQRAELFVDDGARAGGGGLQVKAIVLHDLTDLTAARIVGEERGSSFTI